MSTITPADHDRVEQLVAARRPGHGLERAFYSDETIYRAELDRIWRRGWLFAGHTCQLPEAGDYFTFAVDADSLIVVRGDGGDIQALWNVCRHRGTLLCTEDSGRVGRFVCPYHQWTYARDGSLVSCRGMQDDIDRDQLGLRRAHCRVLEGLIFISVADDPPDFEPAAELVGPAARPQGLDRARIAATVDYDVAANWKIVWENNRECYHCNASHPQYIKANFDHYNADDTTPAIEAAIDEATRRSRQQWAERGLAVTHGRTGMANFPDPGPDGWFSANRTPLVEAYVSETMDGQQVAPLMGDYTDADVGTLRIRTMPNFWNHSSCDHGVSTRLLPAGPGRTRVQVTWLVAADAVEDRDYKLDEVMPFWQLTSEQDWAICERVQRGVLSTGYTPGPFSTHKEYNVDAFVRWYLSQLGK